MAELADAADLKSANREVVGVQVPLPPFLCPERCLVGWLRMKPTPSLHSETRCESGSSVSERFCCAARTL